MSSESQRRRDRARDLRHGLLGEDRRHIRNHVEQLDELDDELGRHPRRPWTGEERRDGPTGGGAAGRR